MKHKILNALVVTISICQIARSQTPTGSPTPVAAPKPAAPVRPAKPPVAPSKASPTDEVIQMVKSGLSEGMIISALQKSGKAVDLAPTDMVKLKNAGVSEKIMNVMMSPAAAADAVNAVAATPAPSNIAPVALPPVVPATPSSSAVQDAPVAQAAAAQTADAAPTFAQKKRVVINAFDFSAPETPEMKVWGTNQNIGKGIRAMFITRAQQGGKVIVIERGEKESQLEKEQDFNAANRAKQGTGARIGRIQGADAVLAGDITVFGNDNKKTKVTAGAGLFGGVVGGAIGAVKKGSDVDKAVVVIAFRLIDAETSEIIATGEARGESERKSKKGSIWGGMATGAIGVDISNTSSGFQQTIVGEATMNCLDKLSASLNEQTAKMKKRVREVEASVVDVSKGTITIGAGDNDGVNSGETFEIHHVLSVLRDPTTKEVLDKKTELVGTMVVTNVRPRVASGNYTGGLAKATEDYVAIKKLPAQQ